MENAETPQTKFEPVQVEELKEFNTDLLTKLQKKDEDSVLKILKVLSRKQITIELLAESKIGKAISRVKEAKLESKKVGERAD